MPSDSLTSALECFPRQQRQTLAHLLRAAALKAPFFSFGQLLTVWSVFAANDFGGLHAVRSFSGFRRKNQQKVKVATKTLCEQGLLQPESQAVIVPLKGSPTGGPYHAPTTPICTWRPSDGILPGHLRHPIFDEEPSPLFPPARTWRECAFTDRFTFPEPAACPRFAVYAATAETIERVEQENEDLPSRQTFAGSHIICPCFS